VANDFGFLAWSGGTNPGTLVAATRCGLDEDRAAVHGQDRAGAVFLFHRIDVGKGGVFDLADAAHRQLLTACAYIASRSASLKDAHSGLRSTPGETAFTRIGANSTASARVNPFTAPQMLAPSAQPAPDRPHFSGKTLTGESLRWRRRAREARRLAAFPHTLTLCQTPLLFLERS
jgi:hypothetical protein